MPGDTYAIDMSGKPDYTSINIPTGINDFIEVYRSRNLSEDEKKIKLKNIWENSSAAQRRSIESKYPGSEELYGAGRRRRKTKKSKRAHKKTHKRRH